MCAEKISIKQEYIDVAREWSFLVSAFLIIVMYEIGLIINRAASVLIEGFLVKTKIWEKNDYDIDVSEISEKNHKFQSMITELNLMRSHILLYLILAILAVVLGRYWLAFIYVSLIFVFVFGGKKHNTKINKIRKAYYERSVKEEP